MSVHHPVRSRIAIVVAFLAALGLFAVEAPAQDKTEVNMKTATTAVPAGDAIGQAGLAAQLARYGYANQSAQALLGAARILLDQPVVVVEREKQTEGGDEGGEKDGDGVPSSLDPTDLLDQAERLAGADEAVLTLVERLRVDAASQQPGRVGGPGYTEGVVAAWGTDIYVIKFRGGEWAEIGVRGDGDTDLDCYVYDENGNLIDSDTDSTDICILAFVPQWTGPFELQIRNLGSVYNRYVLITN